MPPPSAIFLGSSPLTALVRCPCGYRNFFDRDRWRESIFAVCDNCAARIEYDSLRIFHFTVGRSCMRGDEIKFEETLARLKIIALFTEAAARLEKAGVLLRQEGQRERAHKALNIAQRAAAQKCLLAQVWSIVDCNRTSESCSVKRKL